MRVGDTVEIRLTNARFAQNMHSIDRHAVTGSGGGAAVTQIRPGEAGAFEPDWTPSCPGVPLSGVLVWAALACLAANVLATVRSPGGRPHAVPVAIGRRIE